MFFSHLDRQSTCSLFTECCRICISQKSDTFRMALMWRMSSKDRRLPLSFNRHQIIPSELFSSTKPLKQPITCTLSVNWFTFKCHKSFICALISCYNLYAVSRRVCERGRVYWFFFFNVWVLEACGETVDSQRNLHTAVENVKKRTLKIFFAWKDPATFGISTKSHSFLF